jgi:hypothetical protein
MEETAMRGFYKLIAACAVGTAILSAPAFAGDSTHRVDARQDRQKARIEQGIASGELTRHETRRAIEGQRHVDRIENRATADGVVTGKERAHLEYAQDRQSARIYDLKHNNRDRN